MHELLGGEPQDPALAGLVEVLCASDRPESILIWKRAPKVQQLLRSLGAGAIPATHDGLDTTPGRTTEHQRALMQHHGLLPYRDPWIPVFEQWIQAKVEPLPDELRRPVERFATWHHLRRIRAIEATGESTRPAIRSAKQEITETTKFLSWLYQTHGRTAAECTPHDIEEWTAGGPTTRTLIRTFVVKTLPAFTGTKIRMPHRPPASTPSITQDQRLAWIHELLTGSSETLAYRVAGILILLYAQPLNRIAALRTDAVQDESTMKITLGKHPVDVPEPLAITSTSTQSCTDFATSGSATSAHATRALGELVVECPPPIVADGLNYSYQVATKHAAAAGEPWARYTGRRIREP